MVVVVVVDSIIERAFLLFITYFELFVFPPAFPWLLPILKTINNVTLTILESYPVPLAIICTLNFFEERSFVFNEKALLLLL